VKRSRLEPDQEHPLGYGKVIYFWSFIVAVLLFSVGGIFSIYEGYHKLSSSEPLHQVWVALCVLGFSIVLETFSTAGALREIKKIRGEKSLLHWIKHSRNAELVVILGEDLAALLGLSLAFIFLSIAALSERPVFDAIGSIAIGTILLIISIFVAIRVKSLLIGRSADPEIAAAIKRAIENSESIEAAYNLITLQIGPQIMLAAKIKMIAGISLEKAVADINKLEINLKREFSNLRWIFIEPDNKV
jgi:divalent metal cation (Fe/Co/Zn/Cd) transporter